MPLRLNKEKWGWLTGPLFWVELFAIGNIGFLAVDVAVAHAINAFAHKAEYVPVAFSLAAAPLLALAMLIGGPLPAPRGLWPSKTPRWRARTAWTIGVLVGCGSILVGLAGLFFHLDSVFFEEQTLRNLVYTAPFAAPLAYTGLGFLVLLSRMVDARGPEWAGWVVVLAAGGWAGNFVLSLADHAQNGFFYPTEWIGVVSSALAFGFLTAVVVVPGNRPLRFTALGVMVVQLAVGLLGFYLHVRGNLAKPTASVWESFLYGAPAFAPLLFDDLALLGLLGLWAQATSRSDAS
ncbi:hypothetical protein [Paludisphaera borealis]|uniref:Uncharacterized protein n=1 Tax=Paludisphaera borealis TaxID=1387353 RepID=A0A1U7CYD7_9BACT|nr:hypothetical protein [Paludisphaera borealis]APW63889.1 hypothetical protein BSF38_05476 [Paludisphaera borealis]